jgi:putative transposase
MLATVRYFEVASHRCSSTATLTLSVSRYVHRNPIEAGLVRDAWDWPWSSARAYVGMAAPPAWLRMDAILDMFGDQRGGYSEFIKAEVDEPTR